MQPGIAAYLPPPRIGHTEVFLENFRRFPAKNPAVFYSDYDWKISGMEKIPLIHAIPNKRWAASNLVFLHGLRLAIQRGWSHLIYLENDCRVGKAGWDQVMIDEFRQFPNWESMLGAGSLAVYDPFCAGGQAAQKFCDLVARYNSRRNYPVPGYLPVRAFGHKDQADASGSCVFPNGALSIFHVEHLKALFGKVEIVALANKMGAWDAEIGRRVWAQHGVGAYDLFGVLTRIYSGYGNVVTSEEERQQLLTDGQVVAVHQIKTDWQPPEPTPINIRLDPAPKPPPKPKVCPPYSPEPFVLVLHFCRKDSELMLANVKWMEELGGSKEQDALIAYDSNTPKEQAEEIQTIAKHIFREVHGFKYPTPANNQWPFGPNHGFQWVARHVHEKIKRPWFWMEADAVPLKPKWLVVLQAEYLQARRPLMGPVVPGRGHCNGVSVYPANFAKLSPRAMKATAAAWDYEMKEETIHMTHDAGRIIQHVWGVLAGTPHPFLGEAPVFDTPEKLNWIMPGAVVFHRCKDGSLIRQLRQHANGNSNR